MRLHLPSFLLGALFLIMVVLAIGLLAQASAETWSVLSVRSYHLDRNNQVEANYGAGIEIRTSPVWYRLAGAYRNSSGDLTLYAGATRTLWRDGGVQLRAMAVAATGYDSYPIVIPAGVVTFDGRHVGANLGFIPGAGGVFFLQLRWRIE